MNSPEKEINVAWTFLLLEKWKQQAQLMYPPTLNEVYKQKEKLDIRKVDKWNYLRITWTSFTTRKTRTSNIPTQSGSLAIDEAENKTTWNEEMCVKKVDKQKSLKKEIDMLFKRVSQPSKQTNKQVQYTYLKPKA